MANEIGAPWQEIIAPMPPPPPIWPGLAWWGAGLLLALLLAWLLRRWWQQPRRRTARRLGRIRRGLVSGRLGPREGLHAAAACLGGASLDEADERRLVQRFARQPPEPAEVEALLRRLQGGAAR
jgi:hypothetical protein